MDFKKIKYSDFINPDKKTFNDIVEAFAMLNTAFENTEKSIKSKGEAISESLNSVTKNAKKLKNEIGDFKIDDAGTSTELEKMRKALEKLRKENDKLKKEKKEVSEIEKQLNRERDKQNKLLAREALKTNELVKANEKLNAKIQIENRERKKQIKIELTQNRISDESVKVTKAETESIDELSAVLSLNIAQYNKLSKVQRDNINIGGKMLNAIQEQDKALKDLKKEYGDTRLSVGNYKDSVIEALNETTPFMSGIQASITKFKSMGSALSATTKQLGWLKTALISSGIGVIILALGAMATALKKTKEGSDALRVGFSGLGGAFNVMIGEIASYGSMLLGLTKETNKADKSTKSLWARMKEAGNNAAAIEKLTIQYERLLTITERTAKAYKEQARLYTDIQENDVLGYEIRKSAAKDAQIAIEKSFKNELIIIEKRTEIAKKRIDEARRAGLNDVALKQEYQELLVQNSELETEYLDFLRNQTELRTKMLSDEAESKLDVVFLVNEALKDSQREILDNEKSTIKERQKAQADFSNTQKANLDVLKNDAINFIELSRAENIKLLKLQIEGIDRVAKKQKNRTIEQTEQYYLLEKRLIEQQELQKKGFDLEAILRAKTAKEINEQFKKQAIGEKFQLRIVEILQLENEQRIELSQIIKDNAGKDKTLTLDSLEFRLRMQNINNAEIQKLAELRLKREKELLKNEQITVIEYNKAIKKEVEKINNSLIKNKENYYLEALKLRSEYGKLTKKEMDTLLETELIKERELLNKKLITLKEYNAKKTYLAKKYAKTENLNNNNDYIDSLKIRVKYEKLSIKEINDLIDSQLINEKKLLEQGKLSIEVYEKKRASVAKNIKQEESYRSLLSSPVSKTLVNESAKLIENEVVRAGITAFSNSIQKGNDVTSATKSALYALTNAQIIKSVAKTAKKEGGTVMGREGLILVNEEGPEFVINHETTKRLGLQNNATMTDFNNKIDSMQHESYIKALADSANIKNNNNFPTAKEIGVEVSKSIPYAKLDFFDTHTRLLLKNDRKVIKEIVYKSSDRHL